ncbi:MAG: sugar transferase [Acidimicrobiales bacterium]
MTMARPEYARGFGLRQDLDHQEEQSLREIGAAVDKAPLEEQLVPGLMESSPEFFHLHAQRTGLGIAAIAVDGLGLVLTMALAAALESTTHSHGSAVAMWWALERLLVCLPVLMAMLAGSRHRMARQLQTTLTKQVHAVAMALGAGGFACLAAWRLLNISVGTSKPPVDGLLVTVVAGALSLAALRTWWHAPGRRNGSGERRVVVVGSGLVADRVSTRMEASGRVRVVGYVDDDPKDPEGCLGSMSDLAEVCRRERVDHVVVAFSRSNAETIVEAIRTVQGRLPISVVPRLFDVLPATADAHDLASGYPAMSVGPATLGLWPRGAKRAMDIVGGAIVLLFAVPVLLAAAVGVLVTSRGPILIRQTRVGHNGREFTVFKFRTFTVTESSPPPEILAAHESVTGPFPKLKDDPRATPFGKILRRTSIDELPQILNVLSGSMALVGPRPLQPEFAWSFGNWALRRYAVKPGLTGLWQVSGRNDLTYEEMCRLDHLYVTCWSVGLDARILASTARAVLGGRGCY